MRILLLEDENHLRQVIKLNLEERGFDITAVENGLQALNLISKEHFDIAILDIMVPDITGYQVCERIKLTRPSLPIIFISAKDQSSDRIKGLKLGADDYLSKPFNIEELVLRMQNIFKRNDKEASISILNFGGNTIDFRTFEASNFRDTRYSLTKKEVELLKLFNINENKPISRQHILQSVWGYDIFPSTRTIDNFILNFRKMFELYPKVPIHFISIRGVGYKFIKTP